MKKIKYKNKWTNERGEGGVYVLYLLLEGLGVEAFEMIPDELQPIYRQLRIAKNSPDPITALHATSALDQLSSILHDFCLPQESSSPLHILR